MRVLFFKQFICLLVVGSVLNGSIDVPDQILYSQKKINRIHNYNEMESIAELVAENWLRLGNVFPERKNDDANGTSTLQKMNVDWLFAPVFNMYDLFVFQGERAFFSDRYISPLLYVFSDTESPPPNL